MSAKRISLIGLYVALLTVSAKISIPFVPVPMTMQSAVVLFFACYLGLADASIGISLYIVLGLIGVPVFASGGGFSYVVVPSFGFTLGFVVSTVLCGVIFKRGVGLKNLILTLLVGTVALYVVGITYFLLLKAFYLGGTIDIWNILLKFWIVFIPSDILKAVICAVLLKRVPYFGDNVKNQE